MTTVFFLFFLHLALGLMLALAFVTERAGERFFKFCAAAATFMAACALYLLFRRFGAGGGAGAPGGEEYPLLLGAGLVSTVGMVLYNRAWHFGWRRLLRPSRTGTTEVRDSHFNLPPKRSRRRRSVWRAATRTVEG